MSEFIEHLKEVFIDFGLIHTRKMFGGYGIYHRSVMFGLVANETLYLKVNAELIKKFEDKGLRPFEYQKGHKVVKMSYYMSPAEIFDDPEEAALWATRSYEAALQAQTKSKANKNT